MWRPKAKQPERIPATKKIHIDTWLLALKDSAAKYNPFNHP
jgi:hypothetical protein